MESKQNEMNFNVFLNHPWEYFKLLTKIPRQSQDEQCICTALAAFARHCGLECKIDDSNNVLIKKGGTEGRENEEPVVLQGHMDMVFETIDPVAYPYYEALKILVEQDIVQAEGTSLGADNGLGVALILSVLAAADISHPPIEALFTAGEEDGLLGAMHIEDNWLEGRRLINLDGEAESVIIAGCAGAFRAELSIPIIYREKKVEECRNEENNTVDLFVCLEIELKGLMGGHSGLDIDKHRANANVLMGDLLWRLAEELDLFICEVAGGTRMNGIPTSAKAIIAIPSQEMQKGYEMVHTFGREVKQRLSKEDAGFCWSVEEKKEKYILFDKITTDKILQAYLLIPNGVLERSEEISELVQTSSNLGEIRTTEDAILFISNPRSSVQGELERMEYKMKALGKALHGGVTIDSAYPPWEFQQNSPLRQVYKNTYEEMFSQRMNIMMLHGGLECGVLVKKFFGMDAISVGPTINNVHTVHENFSITSLERAWIVLKKVLKKI